MHNRTVKNKKKVVILIVLNDFQNDSRVLKEAKSLIASGYDATVLALHDTNLREKELISNVPVWRMWLASKNLPKNYLFQFFKYIEFLIRAVIFCRNADILHCNDLDALPVGFVVKTFINRKVKIVYDAHEYETEVNSLHGFAKRLAQFLERRLIVCADRVITVSDSIAIEYVKNYSIKKPALVLNCPPYSCVSRQNRFRESFGIRNDQLIFLYQGGLGPGRGIELLIEAFVTLDTDKAVLVFMGYGPYRSLVIRQASLSSNIFFHEAVPPDVLLQYTSSADYGISFIEDTCLNYRYCLPNKVFEYLMAGIPILVSNLVEMRRFVENNNIGIVAVENTVSGYVATIKATLGMDSSEFIKNGSAARKIFNWEKQEKILIGLYSGL